MVRRPSPLFACAMVAALAGCVGPAPEGALVAYRPGATPETQKVTCEATYALVPLDGVGPPIVGHRAVKGERLGFQRQPDGSVAAVAPGYTFPLAPGGYAWEVVPGSVPSQRERLLCETREHTFRALKWTGIAIAAVCVAFAVLIVLLVIGLSTSSGRGWI